MFIIIFNISLNGRKQPIFDRFWNTQNLNKGNEIKAFIRSFELSRDFGFWWSIMLKCSIKLGVTEILAGLRSFRDKNQNRADQHFIFYRFHFDSFFSGFRSYTDLARYFTLFVFEELENLHHFCIILLKWFIW